MHKLCIGMLVGFIVSVILFPKLLRCDHTHCSRGHSLSSLSDGGFLLFSYRCSEIQKHLGTSRF
jgi:hypothetical protein